MLSVRNLIKSYGAVQAVKDISFNVKDGDIFTLLGPSGCGKTTTLQCIAGLETPTSGQISMADTIIFDSDKNILVPANKRRLGMVFQSYAIWPHMSVFDNVAFPLVHGASRLSGDVVRKKVMRALALVKMDSFADRPAPHLSGGQQQRIALARAIVHEPRLLLLDEPLSNLDAKLRDVMRVELRQLIKDLGITTIFVTHDQVEALSMSDQVMLLNEGRIVQIGTPREIYLRPETGFASDFMGRSNLIPGKLVDAKNGVVETAIGPIHCATPVPPNLTDRVCIAIRPQAIDVKPANTAAVDQNQFVGRITELHFFGDVVEAKVDVKGLAIRATFSPYLEFAIGDDILLGLGQDRCVTVSDDTDAWKSTGTALDVSNVG